MLTLNAAQHPLMRLFHKPTDEKRMVVILHNDQYDDWLNARPEHSKPLLRAYPADHLIASAALGPQTTLF
jgi:putative SOS response-associated peptidase YedK